MTGEAPLLMAFDGPAASGKGTLASVIAADYRLPYLDTGLIYRAAGHLAHVRDIDPALAARLITPDILADDALRGREAGERASQVAALPAVRAALKQYQTDFAHQAAGAVLDGRDIGTVIAPDAGVKIFVTADQDIRAQTALAAAGQAQSHPDVRRGFERYPHPRRPRFRPRRRTA